MKTQISKGKKNREGGGTFSAPLYKRDYVSVREKIHTKGYKWTSLLQGNQYYTSKTGGIQNEDIND